MRPKRIAKYLLRAVGLEDQSRRALRKAEAYRWMLDPKFRKKRILDEIREFNPGVGPKPKGSARVITVWDADGKYAWLDRVAKNDAEIDLIHMPRRVVDPVFRHLFEEYIEKSSDSSFNEEFFGEPYAEKRKRFYDFSLSVVEILKREFEIDLFITPKVHDDWITVFIKAIQARGIEVLTNDREPVNSPQRLKIAPTFYKKYVDTRPNRICVASEMHREFWIRGGLPAEMIKVTGGIKTDFWSHPELFKKPNEIHHGILPDRMLITFFAFGRHNFKAYYYPEEKRDWGELSHEFHQELLSVLSEYSNRVQLLYKVGGRPGRDLYPGYPEFEKALSRFPGTLIHLDRSFSALDLMTISDAMIGFQTSALIESMFTARPILSIGWGDLYGDLEETLIPFRNSGALEFSGSPGEFSTRLRALIEGGKAQTVSDSEMSARKAFREKYFFCPNGEASLRLLNEARSMLGFSRRSQRASTQAPHHSQEVLTSEHP